MKGVVVSAFSAAPSPDSGLMPGGKSIGRKRPACRSSTVKTQRSSATHPAPSQMRNTQLRALRFSYFRKPRTRMRHLFFPDFRPLRDSVGPLWGYPAASEGLCRDTLGLGTPEKSLGIFGVMLRGRESGQQVPGVLARSRCCGGVVTTLKEAKTFHEEHGRHSTSGSC